MEAGGDGWLSEGTVAVPLLGEVAAGQPLEMYTVDEHLHVPETLWKGRKVFALRVRGESMLDAGIHDGDMVLARRQETARDGEIAVVVIGEEATVKTVRHTKRGLRLEPANRKCKPIVPEPGEEVIIAGKVIMAVKVFGE